MSRTFLYRHERSYKPEALRWAWALGLVYNVYHEWPVDLPVALAAAEHGFRKPLANAREYTARDWDITDRASLVSALVGLGRGGHRRRHRALVRRLCVLPSGSWDRYEGNDLEAAKGGDDDAHQRLWRMWAVYKDILGCRTASFLAFDAARAAMLARCGFAFGWLGEDELRGYLFDLAREAAATFASWADYARDFEIGRAFWAGSLDAEPWPALHRRLLADSDSPWLRLPFVFPETEEERAVTSLDARDGAPFWTLESPCVALADRGIAA